MLQSIAEYYRVLQNVTEYYRVFLAHLLGPIFGLVNSWSHNAQLSQLDLFFFLRLIWFVTQSTFGLVLQLHSQVTEPEFVRFCVLDPELGDSVVRIFRAVIRENNFDGLLAHLFKNILSLWMIEVMWSFVSESWSFLFERWTSGIFFQQTKPPKVKIYVVPSTNPCIGELTKIHMSKDGMFWQGSRAPLNVYILKSQNVLEGSLLGQTERDNVWDCHQPFTSEGRDGIEISCQFNCRFSMFSSVYILWT